MAPGPKAEDGPGAPAPHPTYPSRTAPAITTPVIPAPNPGDPQRITELEEERERLGLIKARQCSAVTSSS